MQKNTRKTKGSGIIKNNKQWYKVQNPGEEVKRKYLGNQEGNGLSLATQGKLPFLQKLC